MSTARCRNCLEVIEEDEGIWGLIVSSMPYVTMDIHCREAINGLHQPWTRAEVVLGLAVVHSEGETPCSRCGTRP